MNPAKTRSSRYALAVAAGAVGIALLSTAGADLFPSFEGRAQQTPAPAQAIGQPPGVSGQDVPSEAAGVLQQIKAADDELMAVSEEDGRFLRVMVVMSNAKRALEIGTADGYSAIWMGLGLRQTGGQLTTIEHDPARARGAAENIRRAGLGDIVTVVPGDAFQRIPEIAGTFDLVFLDAWKRDYKRFLDLTLPRMNRAGVLLGHNVVNKEEEMRDFLHAIHTDPGLLTAIVKPGHEGMSISVRIDSGERRR